MSIQVLPHKAQLSSAHNSKSSIQSHTDFQLQSPQLPYVETQAIIVQLSQIPAQVKAGNTTWKAEWEAFNEVFGVKIGLMMFMEMARQTAKMMQVVRIGDQRSNLVGRRWVVNVKEKEELEAEVEAT